MTALVHSINLTVFFTGHETVGLVEESRGWQDPAWVFGTAYIGRVERPFEISVKVSKGQDVIESYRQEIYPL